jgi:hypothetical protein
MGVEVLCLILFGVRGSMYRRSRDSKMEGLLADFENHIELASTLSLNTYLLQLCNQDHW